MLFGSTLIRTLCALKSLLFDTVRTVFVLAMGCFYGEIRGVRPINLKRSIHTLLGFLPPSLPSILPSFLASFSAQSLSLHSAFLPSRSSPPQQSALLCTLMTSWRERCTLFSSARVLLSASSPSAPLSLLCISPSPSRVPRL